VVEPQLAIARDCIMFLRSDRTNRSRGWLLGYDIRDILCIEDFYETKMIAAIFVRNLSCLYYI
jgi:hypothetical protein